jgi:hypothetical protein
MLTSLVSIVFTLIIVGLIVYLLLYAVDAVPMPDPFKIVARVIIILVVVLYLLSFLGVYAGGLPRLR